MPVASDFFDKDLIRIFHCYQIWKRFFLNLRIVHKGHVSCRSGIESFRLKTACGHSTLRRDSAMLWV